MGGARSADFDFDALGAERSDLVRALDEKLERFCSSRPLSELNVVFHSTGVNYAHQFYVLSMLGRDRLSQFKSVNIFGNKSG